MLSGGTAQPVAFASMYKYLHFLLRFLVLSVIVVPALSQSSTCFDSGVAGDCSSFVAQFCTNIAKDSIGIRNTASQCFNNPGEPFKCVFTALNVITSPSTPDPNHCQSVLLTLSEDCAMGGEGMVAGGGFLFVIDPNNGTCGLPSST
ncbi:hypothetical protein B0H14DRAFT_3894888 [Mycena olivaceomarginata]|nr:hypothetical protein B0H14DRAFT_3894888 [Mycena olivaceomarginata]